jgi:SHS2 domain-containing protein
MPETASASAYRYFDHDADIGVVGEGDRVETAFVGAARATFALMTDLEDVRPLSQIDVEFEETDLEYALVTWLNLLLAHAHRDALALGQFELLRDDGHWRGSAHGEPWRGGLKRGVDVKGATLTMLRVACANGRCEARCVVDV